MYVLEWPTYGQCGIICAGYMCIYIYIIIRSIVYVYTCIVYIYKYVWTKCHT